MQDDTHDDTRPTVRGSELVRLRLDAGWTQFEIARRTGLSVSTVYRAERGDCSISPRTIAMLARELDVPMDAIYSGPVLGFGPKTDAIRDEHQYQEIIQRLDAIKVSIDRLHVR